MTAFVFVVVALFALNVLAYIFYTFRGLAPGPKERRISVAIEVVLILWGAYLIGQTL
jgi:hypothetical protein